MRIFKGSPGYKFIKKQFSGTNNKTDKIKNAIKTRTWVFAKKV